MTPSTRCRVAAVVTAASLLTGCSAATPHSPKATAAHSAKTASPEVRTAAGVDVARGCVQNGFHYVPATPDGLAVGPHCFSTPDTSTVPPLASVDRRKTPAELTVVEASSPLDPVSYLGRGTFAAVPAAAGPLAANSQQIAAFVANDLPMLSLPDAFDPWLRTGVNIGDGIGADDNIPIYTVDSSNPAQHFVQLISSDARVTSYPKLVSTTSGRIPLPTWFEPSAGGDHALAVHDVATGIWRSYFGVTPTAAGTYSYASAGYWYGDATTRTAGDRNYWLSLVQGSSSVVGLSNELTQIGAQEVRDGVIHHVVSVTFPDYLAGRASFPAKLSDGSLDPAQHPNAPMAGQRFRFPATFDVEAFVRDHHVDATTAAIMRAVKTYGGIVSDRNHWCMAFNLESPLGIAAGASKGQNVYRTDPVLAARVAALNINVFTWASTVWERPNDARS